MAAKKYYGVKKGKITGVFQSWDECKKSIEGFSGAEYKGFATYEEACAFAGVVPGGKAGGGQESGCSRLTSQAPTNYMDQAEACQHSRACVADVAADSRRVENASVSDKHQMSGAVSDSVSGISAHLVVYVDGSYNDALPKYAFGCVFLLPDGRIFVEYGNGDNPQSLKHRNVTGEMLGAMYAVRAAMLNGYSSIEICYDYEGIEKWVTGAWRSKTELTQKYAAAMQEWSRSIRITFTKVAAHTNIKYNELADQTAKRGLTEANGVPRVKRFEEMEQI